MKTLEKTTRDGDTQIFEIIENREELKSEIKSIFWDSLYSEYKTGVWADEDTSIVIVYKDGSIFGYSQGDEVKRLNISSVAKLAYINPSSTVIYGDVKILQNERYGDWETELD